MAREKAAGKPDGETARDTPDTAERAGRSVRAEDEVTEERQVCLFQEMQPGEVARLYRFNDASGRREYHGALTFERAREEWIAGLFGGGGYRAQLMRRASDGTDVVFRSRDFTIPGPYFGVRNKLPGSFDASTTGASAVNDDPAESSAATVAPATAVVRRERDAMSPREMFDSAMMTKMIDMMKEQPARSAGPDWTPLIGTVVTAVTTMMTTLMSSMMQRPGADPAMMELVGIMRADMERLRNAPTPGAAALGDTVATLRDLLELKDDLAGSGKKGGSDEMFGLIPKVLEIMNRGGAQIGPPPAALPEGAVPAPETAPVPDTVPLWVRQLRSYANMLIDAATRNRDPEFIAGIVAEYVPEDMRGTLNELLNAPDTEERIVQAIPELGAFPTWLKAFTNATRAELTDAPLTDEEK